MGRKKKPSNEELLDALRHVCCTEGAVTQFEFCRRMEISTSLIQHRFGNWNRMREAAEVPLVRPGKHRWAYTQEQLLQAMRETVQREGAGVTLFEFSRHTGISQTAVRTHFGTWKNLRAAVGLAPLKTRNQVYSDDEILDDVERLSRELGRFPGAMDLERHGRFAPATYYRRFGPNRKLRKAFAKHRIANELRKREKRIAAEGLRKPAEGEGGERFSERPVPSFTLEWGPDGEWIIPPELAKALADVGGKDDPLLERLMENLPGA